jgi:hypothetical protein
MQFPEPSGGKKERQQNSAKNELKRFSSVNLHCHYNRPPSTQPP